MVMNLPGDVICGFIFPLLSVRDLQSLDTAYTNKDLRPHLRRLWTLYNYDNIDEKLDKYGAYCKYNISWLHRVGIQVVGVKLCFLDRVDDLISLSPLERLVIDIDVSPSILSYLCTELSQLSVLQLHCNLSDENLIAVAQNCHLLHTISWRGHSTTDTAIQALCDNCSHLRHINCNGLSDASLICIASTYPHLQSITIDRDDITDEVLLAIANKCHELKSVVIRSCYYISDACLNELWEANPNLTDVHICVQSDTVYLYRTYEYDMLFLLECCPQLRTLSLYWPDATDDDVIDVANHCPQLTSLNISTFDCISRDALIALGQNCHDLISINMSFVSYCSYEGISALAAGCPLLQEFISSETNISDADVIALARGCRDLRKINLSECQSIGVDGISAIAENCPLISELSLYGCRRVDDVCLYVIANHCRNLTELDVLHTKVTESAVESVITSCRMLKISLSNKNGMYIVRYI